jgi:hypothetical protein
MEQTEYMESPVQDDVIAQYFNQEELEICQDFRKALNRTTLQQRYDGADSFASAQLSRECIMTVKKELN